MSAGDEPVIKPDVVVLDPPVAIELDLDREPNRHLTAEGVADDQTRDRVLASVGWPVLRIRPPGAPTVGEWLWAIEARSASMPSLVSRIIEQLNAAADDLRE